MSEGTQLIVLERLPRIRHKIETIKARILARVERIMALSVTEDNSDEQREFVQR